MADDAYKFPKDYVYIANILEEDDALRVLSAWGPSCARVGEGKHPAMTRDDWLAKLSGLTLEEASRWAERLIAMEIVREDGTILDRAQLYVSRMVTNAEFPKQSVEIHASNDEDYT